MPNLPDGVKKQLEDERDELRAQLERFNGLYSDHGGHGNHPADDATAVFDHALNMGLLRHYERRLTEVEDALHRLERGEHGICVGCGEDIDPARLKVLPEAHLCVGCKGRLRKAA